MARSYGSFEGLQLAVCVLALALARPEVGLARDGLKAIKPMPDSRESAKIQLPPPSLKGKQLGVLLQERISCRNFLDSPLPIVTLSNIMWASCGLQHDTVTGATRTIPSAGATYPIDIYVVVGKKSTNGLNEGVYRYSIEEHALVQVNHKDKRPELAHACLKQQFISKAPVSLIITGKFSKTTGRYGERGERYVYMESGHAAQNIYLAACDAGLGTVEVGAFNDEEVHSVLGLEPGDAPLLVMPLGFPANGKNQ